MPGINQLTAITSATAIIIAFLSRRFEIGDASGLLGHHGGHVDVVLLTLVQLSGQRARVRAQGLRSSLEVRMHVCECVIIC